MNGKYNIERIIHLNILRTNAKIGQLENYLKESHLKSNSQTFLFVIMLILLYGRSFNSVVILLRVL